MPIEQAIADALALAAQASAGPEIVSPSSPDSPFDLSKRELDVLRLLADGRTDREIGEALSISKRTVSTHVSHLMAKLGVGSRTAAAAFALRRGLDRNPSIADQAQLLGPESSPITPESRRFSDA